MLDALRFVSSAVAKKDFVPELCHLRIKDGRVTGFNGQIALSAPIDVDLEVRPQALDLIAAIRACPGVISLHMTPTSRLAVRSERFKAFVPCLPEDHALFVEPEGELVDLGPNFMAGIEAVAPIMGVDASRPWAMGIKLTGSTMHATNNIMLVEYWHGSDIPVDVVIPAAAVNELLRIGEAPTAVRVSENSIAFFFGPDRWMRTQLLLGGAWPLSRLNEILSGPGEGQVALPEGFAEAVETLKPFLGEKSTLYLTPEGIATSFAEGEGASVSIATPGVTEAQAYHHRQLSLLTQVAETIDWSNYPRSCMFRGGAGRMRGAIIGQRL